MINLNMNTNNNNNLHRTYRKFIGTSVACLSIFATVISSGNNVEANTNLQPQIVQAVEAVAEEAPVVASKNFVEKIKEESVKYVGVPYVTGGTTTRGLDCSGFTQLVFKNAGINLPRVSSSQAQIDNMASFKEDTTTIKNKADIQAGDLIFFSNSPGRVSHVGIALEDNKYIHASVSNKSITIANRSGSYYNNKFTKAIRVNQ